MLKIGDFSRLSQLFGELFRDFPGFGIVRHQPQNADRRDASNRSVRSASVSEDLPCLCFPTLASFGSGCRLLPGLACLRLSRRRLYRSWAHRFIARRRVRICWLFLGRRIRLRRRRRSCGLLLRKQQARCEKHKSRTSWHGCGTHVCTIDSQYAGLRCSSPRFGETFLAGSIIRRMSTEAAFPHPQLGDNCLTPGPSPKKKKNRRCPGSRGVA